MNVLWVVNTIFPEAARHIGLKPPVVGGWMYGLADDLARSKLVNLSVMSVYPGKQLKKFILNGIRYYLVPSLGQSRNSALSWQAMQEVALDVCPDLVHIHGTEYGFGMALMNSCPNHRYVVSIQGMVSVYHRYYFGGLSWWDILCNITFRDIIRRDTLFHGKKDFFRRGITEHSYIKRADAILGRTDWDFSHVKAINSRAKYFVCNESLRDEFYEGERWSLMDCRRHSLFLSQGAHPIKGLHQVLKSLAILKHEFKDLLLEIAGHDITNDCSLGAKLKRSGYGKYIKKLIVNLGLERHVKFLGPLQAVEMKRAYLRSHVFICPSSIENSPNSLGEAQLLGVPVVASYCGGIASMVRDGETAVLYRFEEYEMLASKLRDIFRSDDVASRLSSNGREEAALRHDRHRNATTLIKLYENISREE